MKNDEKKKIKNEVDKEIDQRLRERISFELEKIIPEEIYKKTKNSASEFRKEFKKQTITAITAAFAFLIALSWRTPIEKLVNKLITDLNLTGEEIYVQFVSAIIITFIAVVFLIFFSKWQSSGNNP